ncbi:MAG TPA: SDR family oxidoreductase [Gammaproteobacteria bacterium]|nr:SDR family oxidoreductase [Gammaproteobacteria bacterium]
MKVLVTGSKGFIGRNLVVHLGERNDVDLLHFTHDDSISSLVQLVSEADFVFHLAGINRPDNTDDFQTGNADLTSALCDAVVSSGNKIPIIYISSSHAGLDNPYGISKRAAEETLLNLTAIHGSEVYLFRLPNVFGKWARPNYNSVVATFCNNITKDLPITIDEKSAQIRLVYIDDVISHFIALMDGQVKNNETHFYTVEPEYMITIGNLADQLYAFRNSRNSLITEAVGNGLTRALHSTYLSYLRPKMFSYKIPEYRDSRGMFAEILKTHDSGQISFFTAHPGITRGGHYHHSKTEKFLVIKGMACFRFSHIDTGEFYELHTSCVKLEIVETIPGWSHDITNTGNEDIIVMLWANEIFNCDQPDTFTSTIENNN